MKTKFLIQLFFTVCFFACSSNDSSTSATEIDQTDNVKDANSSSVNEINSSADSIASSDDSESSDKSSSSAEEVASSENEKVESSSSHNPSANYDPETGLLTDERDGQVYKTAKIGDQVWMAENFRYDYGKYEEMCEVYSYDDDLDESTLNKYGRHYSWELMMKIPCEYCDKDALIFSETDSLVSIPRQGICPNGWHVPTLDEWQILLNNAPFLDLLSEEWTFIYDNTAGTNKTGFNILRANKDPDHYENIVKFAITNEKNMYEIWSVGIIGDFDKPVEVVTNSKSNHSIYLRCLMD